MALKSEYQMPMQGLAELCQAFLDEEQTDIQNEANLLFLVGQITAACAQIYNLDEPAGILHPSTLFRPYERSE